ncbi:conserved membrane hypothetical protein [Methylocella tundrae]|uniref:DUF423 domain-containing protein n=1 Tax=Methylocella tundrae TaxID=227605 RepID=A0A8B6MB87_METTU|nr:DUF423 domain-containing protein [Methylocella tundrae]VTZ27674.1 conserved membrane hypothetical protein [Methylocella tundrae]VTZ52263.1 conserved membrane hypothetical protein [Methylocella tundrae]
MTAPKIQQLALIAAALAGVAGAAGVILSAVSAHLSASPLLTTAASFLLIHAVATLALAALALAAPRRGGWFLCGAALFLFGSMLFCSDLAFRALLGVRLFPMAAPIGGSALILGWLSSAVAALAALASKAA